MNKLGHGFQTSRMVALIFSAVILLLLMTSSSLASEADIVVPDLEKVSFFGMSGYDLLMVGFIVCLLGMIFGWFAYTGLKKLPVHQSMREISELIYETCKTYLLTQGRFILILWAFIAIIMMVYFGWLRPVGAGNLLI
ncbi:MAG: sodium/proton-translocating pyrophosphatase, partial [candidate division Zixibacteria bacterium]|nr:sodium/proton-translocating pyrophosphatase [candidate division Zixibacteria bacterium]